MSHASETVTSHFHVVMRSVKIIDHAYTHSGKWVWKNSLCEKGVGLFQWRQDYAEFENLWKSEFKALTGSFLVSAMAFRLFSLLTATLMFTQEENNVISALKLQNLVPSYTTPKTNKTFALSSSLLVTDYQHRNETPANIYVPNANTIELHWTLFRMSHFSFTYKLAVP